jgi:hypothetical protein
VSRDKPLELDELVPPPELVERIQARQRERLEQQGQGLPLKRARDFVMLPRRWAAALDGASGQTWQVAVLLLHLYWKEHGGPVRLSNKTTWGAKIPRRSKWRALEDLERRHLILLERRPSRAPIVTVFP